jgi:leader peptidase (prepilin peptidase)/N-methyltransferase
VPLWSAMDIAWAAAGAVAGLLAGAALRGPVFRLSVPAGEPDQTACRGCGAPVSRWLAIRCGDCGRSLGVPAVLELATAAVLALLLGRFGGQPDMVAFGFLGALGVALAAIDIAVQRLPDRLTLPAFPVLVVLLAVAAAIGHDGGALVRALLGSVALAGGYLLLALARPGQLGGGDIKLAALAGLALGWLGWPAVLAGASLGFLLSAVVSLALLAARRITLRSAISFGPFLLGGTLLAVLASGAVPGA